MFLHASAKIPKLIIQSNSTSPIYGNIIVWQWFRKTQIIIHGTSSFLWRLIDRLITTIKSNHHWDICTIGKIQNKHRLFGSSFLCGSCFQCFSCHSLNRWPLGYVFWTCYVFLYLWILDHSESEALKVGFWKWPTSIQ